MFRIAICDDEQSIWTYIENLLINHSSEKNIRIEVETFATGESLCNTIEQGSFFHLIFLDIQLSRLSGIDVCQKIRNDYDNESVQVVYISSHSGYAMQLFEGRPLNFLEKPLSNEKIIANFDKAVSLWDRDTLVFEFTSGRTTRWIKMREIYYFESKNKKVIIHSHAGNEVFYAKLSDVAQQVKDAGFLWVHKSFLVNYNFIRGITYEKVELVDGSILPISKSFRTDVRDYIMKKREELLYE